MKTVPRARKAVYAGSFDPLTTGHLWMIEQGVRLFEDLTVAVGLNPDKRYTFAVDERLAMVRESTAELPGIKIASIGGQFLIEYARTIGATHVLRGIRSPTDYEFERTMRNINGDLRPGITTVFLMPPRGIAEVSSSMVKGLVGPEGWKKVVRRYVPGPVYKHLLARFREAGGDRAL